ncbi:MAG: homoserine dehydrogenase [Gemmatimonadetes bacterium]|nr:homoserine dehydrogenase [Gemmatimonadota bacterium]
MRTAQARPLRIGLAGCGVVGSALVALVAKQAGRLRREHGIAPSFDRVLVRDAAKRRPVDLSRSRVTTGLTDFIGAASEVDVVVEAIGGIEPAASLARAALRGGVPFVTANKALVAAHGQELAALARESGAAFRFEAAVGGGVPIIRTLRDAFGGLTIRRIRGILNGTSNYVLSRMSVDDLPLDAALADARAHGYAEADATRDLDGRDAADKLAILAWLAFGADPARLEVRRQGILPDPARLIRTAAADGLTVRLVAECALGPDTITATVAPAALAPDSELGRTDGAGNRIVIETDEGGIYTLGGPGAGGMATASALLADVLDTVRGCR